MSIQIFFNCNFSLIRTAKRLLTEIVEKGRPAPAFNHNDGPGMTVQEIMVPASKAGLVIGKGGETIKSLQVSVHPVLKWGPQGSSFKQHTHLSQTHSNGKLWFFS